MILIACIDGCGPDYLRKSDIPNLKRMMKSGLYLEGAAVIPSVTNVNNASIATGSFPIDHGITGNYYYDRAADKEYYMESAEYLLRPTIFERAKQHGLRTAFITSKDKLRHLIARGADFAASAEFPPPELVAKLGPKQDVYSAEINYWAARAVWHLFKEGGYDLIYLATTDYMMHTYPPEDDRSQAHMRTLDRILGQIVNDHPNLELYLTADHGMSAKSEAIDLRRLLAASGIAAEAVPIIKDKYVVHHGNLGGACYVYLKPEKDIPKAFEILKNTKGVAEIYRHDDAAERFKLRADRIGDIFLLAEKQVVFGDLKKVREDVRIRSHGSRFEVAVPILCYGRKVEPESYQYNLDIIRNLALTP